ncbi:molybdate ABC transporter substrate-binding protein [bacterium CG17_big_fil_post_rev_8_21_14_2_50_64_8]|nr:MAG: molybdate ABC transporter substrate-binding protein [bacterium CG17_big_fil_post_rev_8_21_14_2_50_64_8]PJA74148.1 MAG: molybdate ABC transporter substrate-binding protein [bacterium CG_4_9_14_3_um_filter_65_15]
MRTLRGFSFLTVLTCALSGAIAHADEVTIAVASNFARPAQEIAAQFETDTGHHVVLAFGSTGKHFAQISNGAPFAAFLAADARRPRLLEEAGLAVTGTRFTYAVGKIVLWSPDKDLVDPDGAVPSSDRFRHLAIANPGLAPYGEAAQQVLQSQGLWDKLADRIVRGENIGQTYQFVQSGNAELGFVASAQLIDEQGRMPGSWWDPPQDSYTPIAQQAVLLREGPAARAFLDYMRSGAARKIITHYRYGAP